MDEEYWADRFSDKLDSIMSSSSDQVDSTSPTEYRQALDLAHRMAALDFSAESRRRESLRRRLVDEARLIALKNREHSMRTLHLRRMLAFTIAGASLALALALNLFYPGGIAAAAENVYRVLRTIILGDYTRAVQVEPQTPNDSMPISPDAWIIRTEIGNFAGNAPPGTEPLVRSLASLEEAQSDVEFPILTPADLPDDYALREVRLAPIGLTHWVFLFYGGPGRDIIIAQMPGGPQPSRNSGEMSGVFTGFVTEGTLQEVELDGHPAVWIDGHSLSWTVGAVTYQVGGLDLTLEEAAPIARSLR